MKNGRHRDFERIELGEYIVADPKICHGKPTFKGTRISVAVLLEQLAGGEAWDSILRGYPELTRADIEAALEDRATNCGRSGCSLA